MTRWWRWVRGTVGFVLLGGGGLAQPAVAPAQEGAALPPLARYVPADKLVVLVEHDGLASQPQAWAATAASRMLRETTLGAMLDDVVAQTLDPALRRATGGEVTGAEVMSLLKHLTMQGFAVGYCGTVNPPEPSAGVLVVRGAEGNPTFRKLLAMVPPLNEPAATKVRQGSRTVFQLNGPPVRWWFEGGDFVVSFVPPDGADPVAETLDGQRKSALSHPARVALAQPDAGDRPVGRIFVDLKALPPLPPDAARWGLDAVTRIDARWSLRGPALSLGLAIQVPQPRRGVLALLDQPAIAPRTALKLPTGQTDATLMAIDFRQTSRVVRDLVAANDPAAAAQAQAALDQFQERTGLRFEDDLMSKVGPRVAVTANGGGSALGLGALVNPPSIGAVVEIREAEALANYLDQLMGFVNRELKAAGRLVPGPPGVSGPPRPGTSAAEFRRHRGPERGYTLAVPPGVMPTPAWFRPTVLVDTKAGLLALGGDPATARRALTTLVLQGAAPGGNAADAPGVRPGEFVRVTSDPSGSLPELLVNIPAAVQFIGLLATQANQPDGAPDDRNGALPFRLEIDPDAIPSTEALRPYLFPTRVALANDPASIRLTVDAALPIPTVSLSSGAEVPVLVALLLPAVQASREAARRSQCSNNCKRLGLAMHNYVATNGVYPTAATKAPDGRPLLSWRVTLLPYLEEGDLYNEFHLDEPWDSPHNKALIPRMPKVFACPSDLRAEPGLTKYRVFTSPGTLFDATQPAAKLEDLLDGTSLTLALVEADEATVWTQPESLVADRTAAGSKHPGGFHAQFADGTVRFLKQTISPALFQALTTRAGGEVISADSF